MYYNSNRCTIYLHVFFNFHPPHFFSKGNPVSNVWATLWWLQCLLQRTSSWEIGGWDRMMFFSFCVYTCACLIRNVWWDFCFPQSLRKPLSPEPCSVGRCVSLLGLHAVNGRSSCDWVSWHRLQVAHVKTTPRRQGDKIQPKQSFITLQMECNLWLLMEDIAWNL